MVIIAYIKKTARMLRCRNKLIVMLVTGLH